jgi:peptide/nickel transport system substrate-binding protein
MRSEKRVMMEFDDAPLAWETINNAMPTREDSGRLQQLDHHVESGARLRTYGIFSLRRHRSALAAALVASFLLFSGLPLTATGHAAAAGGTALKIGMIESIDSLNPFIGVNDNSYIFYGLVYDNLMAVDQDRNIKPNLATSWYIVPDELPYGSVWQYNLTHNAEWHDGEPFDADDVVFTINYQIGVNYDSMWAFQPYTRFIQSIERIDEFTVRIHYKDQSGDPAPCPFGDSLMMPIVPEHIWSEITPYDAGFAYENYFPIGTGAFKCTQNTKDEYIAGDMLILEKNPHYFGEIDYGNKIQFDRLIMKFYLEPAGMLVDVEKGAVDLAGFNAPNYKNLMDWLERNPTDSIGHYAGPSCTGFSVELAVNMNPGSGNATNSLRLDPAVRKAMAHAINKTFIKDSIYAGYAETGSTIIPPIYGDYFWQPNATEIYEYNISKANQILDDAGYVWDSSHTWRLAGAGNLYGSQGKRLSFAVTTEQELVEDRDTVNYLSERWRDIGIELVPEFVNSAQWGTIVYGGSYDLTMTYWSGDPDPNYLLFVQSSFAIGGWSENWYSNPRYDENYTASAEDVNHQERLGYVYNCSKLSYEDAAFIVTVYPYGCYAWRTDHFSNWGDWEAHPGRSLSSFWTANDLYFDLVPLDYGGSDMTPIWIGLGIAAAVVVAVIILLRMRGEKEEEIRLP